MAPDAISWDQLRASASPELQISLDLAILKLHANPYKEFIRTVDQAIDYGLIELSNNKNLFHDLTEDQLSATLIMHLKGMGFSIRHGENNGGHTDIIIDGPNKMRWLGEAKKYTSYAKLFGGARQLINRYSTGTQSQDHGSLIVYISKPNALAIMSKWRDYLIRFVPDISIDPQEDEQIDFVSHLKHLGSGRTVHVRHVAAVLYHKPTDTMSAPKLGHTVGLGTA